MSRAVYLRLLGLFMLASPPLTGCAGNLNATTGTPVVTVQDVRDAPQSWDGKRVRIAGWLTRDFENMNLYASWEAACGSAEHPEVIGAFTDELLDFGTMRQGVFEGTFSNFYGTARNDEIVISTGHAWPGPLEHLKVVRWLSRSQPACR